VVTHADRGQVQSAYRVVVNATATGATVWDSGVVNSAATTHIVYAGSPLTSNTYYTWAVQWYDGNKAAAPWSAPATFGTGILTQSGWAASNWITCPANVNNNQLRAEFTVGAPAGVTVTQARMYITGVGYYMASMNGALLNRARLDPAWTTYPQRVLYTSYDVTGLVSATAANAIAVYIGNGWPDVSPK
jgi:alpha-L-rhamnosidase